MAATKKQLEALKKARAARAKKLGKKVATKKRKTNPTKSRPKRKTSRVTTITRYVAYAKKVNGGKKYYLQKQGTNWIWNTDRPPGAPKATITKFAKREAKYLPDGWAVYLEKK